MRFRHGFFLLIAVSLGATAAHAQTYPTKPIRLVIGSFPGGGIDLAGRILAQKMTDNLGQQVIVDNRGGANGIIGMEVVAKAAPDGYTFYMGTTGHISVNPSIRLKLPFDVDRDFSPLTAVVSLPFLAGHGSALFGSVQSAASFRHPRQTGEPRIRCGRSRACAIRCVQKVRASAVGARGQGSWGSATLDGNEPECMRVAVRALFCRLKDSKHCV